MNRVNNNVDLPKLEIITLEDSALLGDENPDRKTNNTAPYYYKNTLTMRSIVSNGIVLIDLPSLTTINGQYRHFRYMGSVVLESSDMLKELCIDIPNLSSRLVSFGSFSFGFTYSLQSSSIHSCVS